MGVRLSPPCQGFSMIFPERNHPWLGYPMTLEIPKWPHVASPKFTGEMLKDQKSLGDEYRDEAPAEPKYRFHDMMLWGVGQQTWIFNDMYVLIYIYSHTCMYMYLYMYVYMCMRMSMCVYVYVYR